MDFKNILDVQKIFSHSIEGRELLTSRIRMEACVDASEETNNLSFSAFYSFDFLLQNGFFLVTMELLDEHVIHGELPTHFVFNVEVHRIDLKTTKKD